MADLTTSDTRHLLDLAERMGMPADEALRQVRQLDMSDPGASAARTARTERQEREYARKD